MVLKALPAWQQSSQCIHLAESTHHTTVFAGLLPGLTLPDGCIGFSQRCLLNDLEGLNGAVRCTPPQMLGLKSSIVSLRGSKGCRLRMGTSGCMP